MGDDRTHLYHNLSVMLAAGVPITRALRSVHKSGKTGRLFTRIAEEVAAGHSLTDVVRSHHRSFPQLDITLIEVGEETGQLPEMFEAMSQWYAFRRRLRRVIRSGMILPILYIHATAFIVPVISCAFSEFDPAVYVRGVLVILGLFYIPAAVIMAVICWTPKRGPLRYILDRISISLPLLGGAIRELELSRYCKVFAMTYKAGLPIVRCAQMATDAVANRVMLAWLKGACEVVKTGEEMSKGFSRSLPGEFLGIWQTGEDSGDLDDAAFRLGRMHADNAEAKWTAIAQWTPRLVYAVVAMVMIYFILKGYSQIFSRTFTM